jgi:hypothetical protein
MNKLACETTTMAGALDAFTFEAGALQICLDPGKFVQRKRPPTTNLPERETCPAILSRYSWIGTAAERRVECCVGRRAAALEAQRFVPCDGHRAPSLATVLSALRGRTIAFVGDSTMQQLWTGLLAELYRAPLTLEITQRVLEYDMRPQNHNRDAMCTVSHTNPPRQGGSQINFRLDARAAPLTCNLTQYRGGPAQSSWPLLAECRALPDLEMMVPEADVLFLFYRVDANISKSVRPAFRQSQHCRTPEMLFERRIDAALEAADAAVANIGVWYGRGAEWASTTPDRTAERYRADVRHLLGRLNGLAPQGKLGLYRESTPQHFETSTGSGLFEERQKSTGAQFGGRRLGGGAHGAKGCLQECPPLGPQYRDRPDWRNEVMMTEAAALRFPADAIVPVGALLRPMANAHKDTKWACELDCTHYCYHPLLWSGLLDGLYRRWYRWALTAGRSLPLAPRRWDLLGADLPSEEGKRILRSRTLAGKVGNGKVGNGKASMLQAKLLRREEKLKLASRSRAADP